MGRVVIPGFRKIETSGGGEGGTTNYNDLTNKPFINNVPLVGNLSTVNLKLTDATLTEEGVPAEAKTVGAKLEEQSTSLTAVKEELTKKVNVSDIPTKVSELQNDSNYQTDTDVTNTLTTYATKTYVGEQISSVDHLKREIVTEIPGPETADKNTIYMLKIESATGEDKYKEYLLIDGTLQCIGDTSVDLTDYAKKTEIPTELPANGGNSLTVNGHTVKSDVPENAVFTDTVYDDTEIKEEIANINSNLEQLEFGENSGNNNLWCLKNSYSISGSGEIINDLFSLHKGVYILSFDTSTTNGASEWSFKDSNGNRVHSQMIFNYNGTRCSILFQTSGDATKVEVYQNIAGTISNIQIVKGDTNIPYEPHIPSVKMLAEDVGNIKNDLSTKLGEFAKFYSFVANTTTFTFEVPGINRYQYGLIIGGFNEGSQFVGVYCNDSLGWRVWSISKGEDVSVPSISYDNGIVTLEFNLTMYGGIRVITLG